MKYMSNIYLHKINGDLQKSANVFSNEYLL